MIAKTGGCALGARIGEKGRRKAGPPFDGPGGGISKEKKAALGRGKNSRLRRHGRRPARRWQSGVGSQKKRRVGIFNTDPSAKGARGSPRRAFGAWGFPLGGQNWEEGDESDHWEARLRSKN